MFIMYILGIFIHLLLIQQIFEEFLCVGCWGYINSIIYFNFVFKIYDNLVANVSNKLYLKIKVLKYINYRLS